MYLNFDKKKQNPKQTTYFFFSHQNRLSHMFKAHDQHIYKFTDGLILNNNKNLPKNGQKPLSKRKIATIHLYQT